MALKRIALRDFVIVQELDLELEAGFTVLTGETGAGKSILIDALQLVTGGRADTGLIREGASRTEISAEFDATPALTAWLEDAGFELADSILLRRTLDTKGKSRAWINGSAATATQLRTLGAQLLDIHGQHAWQSLTRPEAVTGLLDSYARLSTLTLHALWQHWRQTHNKLAQAQAAQASMQQEQDRLTWQIGELEKLAPQAGEWDALNAEHGRLSHAQALLDTAQQAILTLDGDDGGAMTALQSTCHSLQQLEHLEPVYRACREVLQSSLAQVDDTVHSLRAYLRRAEPDPQRLRELDERMAMWLSLARRYRRTPAELPDLLAAWRQELVQLNAASDLATLEALQANARDSYMQEATRISQARGKAAPQLAKTITQCMQGLGMQGGRFEVTLEQAPQPSPGGLEEVCFLVAGHAGSTPRPVNHVASGGELSRIALAIAVTTSALGTAQTLIFDEVDAGIGGAVAETVGRLMKQLGMDRQVLAVTHLPQVAACADHHLVVAKQLLGQTTVSSVTAVRDAPRVAELARMLGGERLLDATLAHAKELLNAEK